MIEYCQRIYSQSEYITQDVPHALGGQRRIASGVLRRHRRGAAIEQESALGAKTVGGPPAGRHHNSDYQDIRG
jgi:hypothetical protein